MLYIILAYYLVENKMNKKTQFVSPILVRIIKNNNYIRKVHGQDASLQPSSYALEFVSNHPQTLSSLQHESTLKMQQQHQQFQDMEMPTQSSPNDSQHHSSQIYHHSHQQHSSTSQASGTGSSGLKRVSSQSSNISTSSPLNPNGINAIASSSHCVSSSSSSPPPNNSGNRHCYPTLPSSGPPTPPGAHCITEPTFNSPQCYNTAEVITSGVASHGILPCPHLSSGQQHAVPSYLQGIEVSLNLRSFVDYVKSRI